MTETSHIVSKYEDEESIKDKGSKYEWYGEVDLEAELIYALEEIEKCILEGTNIWKDNCQNTKKS